MRNNIDGQVAAASRKMASCATFSSISQETRSTLRRGMPIQTLQRRLCLGRESAVYPMAEAMRFGNKLTACSTFSLHHSRPNNFDASGDCITQDGILRYIFVHLTRDSFHAPAWNVNPDAPASTLFRPGECGLSDGRGDEIREQANSLFYILAPCQTSPMSKWRLHHARWHLALHFRPSHKRLVPRSGVECKSRRSSVDSG